MLTRFSGMMILLSTLISTVSFCVTKNSTGSTNWNTSGTWNPSGVPSAGDCVAILTGHSVTLNANGTCGAIRIEGTLAFDATNNRTLTVTTSAGMSGNVYIPGTLTWGAIATGQIAYVAGNFNCSGLMNNGNETGGDPTLVMNGTGSKTISNTDNFGSVEINSSTLTVTASTNIDIVRNLRIVAGTLDIGSFTANRALSGETFSISNGATLRLAGSSNFPSNYGSYSLGATSTVNYIGAAQTVSSKSYGHLTLSGSGTKTMPASALSIAGDFSTSGTAAATASGALTVIGNFAIGSGTTFNASSFTHQVGGNWSNAGTFNAGTSTFVLNGSSTRTKTGSTMYNLTINNSAGVTLQSSDETVTNTLTLTSGNITTGTTTLTLGTSTSSLGTLTRTSGTIVGNFRRWFAGATVSNVLFPVGTATYYRPANVSFTVAPSAGGTLTASFTASNPGTNGLPLNDAGTSIVNCGVDGFWTLTLGNGLTGGTYSLDLTADGFGNVSDFTTLRILKRANSSSPWTLDGTHSPGTGSTSIPIVHRTGMSGFSEFGIGGASDNPLPIQLVYFTGAVVANSNDVLLTWGTISETNNYGFFVQQSVATPSSFADVPNSFVAGHGTTTVPQNYSWTHSNVSPGTWNYRLKQIDLDGTVHYTDAVEVVVGGLTGIDEQDVPRVFSLSQNYPNPFNPSTLIRYTLPKESSVSLKVYNTLGQEVAVLAEGVQNSGEYQVRLDASSLASGTYLYRLSTDDFTSSKKLIVLR